MSDLMTQRAKAVTPFHVMDILAKANSLQAQGKDIIHMEIGEPDFVTPAPIIKAGIKALEQGKTHYTPALGLPELRQRIADWYQQRYGVVLDAHRVVITPGASGALLLLTGMLLEHDKKVMLADPGYPCNHNFARFVGAQTLAVPVTADSAYQLTAEHIKHYWDASTSMALVASPSNPTGTILDLAALASLSAAVKQQHGVLVVDEIYHGLSYDGIDVPSVLQVDQQAFVINSFSKFFGMTGWRLGWMVVPEAYIDVADRLAQNLFLAATTPSQYAALAAFTDETLTILEQRRQILQQRRDSLLPALQQLGFAIPCVPQGAFYLYADCSALLGEHCVDSMALSHYLLEKAGIAVTPGSDFGSFRAEQHCRFAYVVDEQRLQQAVDRMQTVLKP